MKEIKGGGKEMLDDAVYVVDMSEVSALSEVYPNWTSTDQSVLQLRHLLVAWFDLITGVQRWSD